MRKGLIRLGVLVIGLGIATGAQAVDFTFKGYVLATSGNLIGTAFQNTFVNTQFTVNLTYNIVPDAQPDPTRGTYPGNITAFALNIDGHFDQSANGSITIFNNHIIDDDEFLASTFLQNQISAAISLEDPTETAFSSDALPTSLNMRAFSHSRLVLSHPNGSVVGVITVPEPAALSFIGLAGVFLGRRRR